jgi:hypothetical protein
MNTHRLQRVVAIACLMTSFIAPAAFTAGREKLKSLSSLTVVDADDQKVAPVISLIQANVNGPFAAVVVFDVDRQPFALQVTPLEFSGIGQGPFFFSADCSGTPMVGSSSLSFPLIELATVSAPGQTVYVSDPDATTQTLPPFSGSLLHPDGTCGSLGGRPFPTELIAARSIVDLETLFTPPYRVR